MRAVLLCNPHDPTGRVFSREELETIAEVACERDLLVISDEIWGDIIFDGREHIPFASLRAHAAARTVTAPAASKTFSMAGLKCAVAHIGVKKGGRVLERIAPDPGPDPCSSRLSDPLEPDSYRFLRPSESFIVRMRSLENTRAAIATNTANHTIW